MLVPVDDGLREVLQIWTQPDFLRSMVPMSNPSPEMDLMTDASLTHWSAVLLPQEIRLELRPWDPLLAGASINWLELKAIHLALLEIHHTEGEVAGRCVRVLSDNTTALSCLRFQGTLRSRPLLDLTRDILVFLSLTPFVWYPFFLQVL